MIKCSLLNCVSQSNEHIALYGVPSCQSTRIKWLNFIELEGGARNKSNKNLKLCSRHFQAANFSYNSHGKLYKNQEAFPTVGCSGAVYDENSLFLYDSLKSQETQSLDGFQELSNFTQEPPNVVVQNVQELSINNELLLDLVSSISNLKKKNEELSRLLAVSQSNESRTRLQLTHVLDELNKLKSNLSAYYGKGQLQKLLGSKRPRYEDSELEKAAHVVQLSGQRILNTLDKNFCPMPDPKTIYNHFKSFEFEPGPQKFNMRQIKKKGENLEPWQKKLVIGFDEKQIVPGIKFNPSTKKLIGFSTLEPTDNHLNKNPNKIANHGLLFLAMGLNPRVKEIIGFDFTTGATKAESLKARLFELIVKTEAESTWEVEGSVFDMGPDNLSLMKLLGYKFTKQDPVFYIPHPADPSRKFLAFPDLVHIAKNLSCGIRNHDLIISRKIMNEFNLESNRATFKDVEKLYEYQKSKPIKIAPKLTHAVMFPSNFQKMRENIAYDLMSLEVTQGIDLLHKGSKKNPTSFFLETLNKLQLIFNNPHGWNKDDVTSYCDDKKFLIWLSDDFLPNVTFEMKRGSMKSVEGAIVAIKSLVYLSEKLFSEGATRIYAKNILNNATENIFSQVTMHYLKPDALQFQRALKGICIKNSTNPVRGSSYNFDSSQDDNSQFLSALQTFNIEESAKHMEYEEKAVDLIQIDNSQKDITDIDLFPDYADLCAFHMQVGKIIGYNQKVLRNCEECCNFLSLVKDDEITSQLSPGSRSFFARLEYSFRYLEEKVDVKEEIFEESFKANATNIKIFDHCFDKQEFFVDKYFRFRSSAAFPSRQKHKIIRFSSKSLSAN